MPILTNHEVAELRKMMSFAHRLLDLIYSLDGNNGLDLKTPVDEIAVELEIKLPIKED